MRLRRLTWVFERNPFYFVTACTQGRARILDNPRVRAEVEAFAAAGPNRGAWMGAYVLMPDHFHAFVALDGREMTLSVWMKAFKRSLSKTLGERGADPPHWQKGFFDHVLRSEESYAQKWNYVRENPVRAGLVARWEDWLYRGEPHPLEGRRS